MVLLTIPFNKLPCSVVVEAVGKGGKSGMAAATLFKRWWLSLVVLVVLLVL